MNHTLDEWVRADGWIMTHTGRQFFPLDPVWTDVDIEDIGHALSLMCRYNGHCSEFYSVAQHSVHVSETVPEQDALWGLLHDGTEAYLPDVPRPVKPNLPGFVGIESRVMRAICQRYGLPFDMPASVKKADRAILFDEMSKLMPHENLRSVHMDGRLGINIEPWSPERAKREFLARFRRLGGV